MDKNKIIALVKDIRSLGKEIVSHLPKLLSLIAKSTPRNLTSILNNFATLMKLDDEKYVVLLDHLIYRRKILEKLSPDHKIELKKLVKSPNLRPYLKGPWI